MDEHEQYPPAPAQADGIAPADPATDGDAAPAEPATDGDAAPAEPAAAPGRRRRSGRAGGRRPRRRLIRRRWLRRTTYAAVTVVLLLATITISGYAYVDHRFHEATFVQVKHLVQVKTSGPHANAQTILLIGSTSRCALNNQQTSAFGSCAAGVTGVNSDVVMLLHTDPSTGRVSILSIPRDLVLYNARPNQFHKVDAALADGPSELVQVIEQDFGIPINHFVELNFDTFQDVVNTLGGVSVDFPDRVYDAQSGLDITTPGCHALNGFQALALVRARHMYYWVDGKQEYDGSGDLGRIVRDHIFLRILGSAVAKRGLGNLVVDNDLLGEIVPDLTLDSSFTLHDMVDLVLDFHSINPYTAPETTMPTIEYYTDYFYEGYDYGSVVLPSYPADQTAIDQWLGISRPPSAAIAPSSFSLAVVDGDGDPTGAADTAAALGKQGYHVVDSSNSWPAVGPLSETIVEYAPGYQAQAQRVMESLSGIVSMAAAPTASTDVAGDDLPESTGADVTVITGTNFSVVAPPAAAGATSGTTSTSTPAATTSTTSSTAAGGSTVISSGSSSVDSLLSPVSSAQDPAPSYDPKPCPAGS